MEELQVGHLHGKTVGRLERLFSVRDDLGKNHKVVLLELLRLRELAKLGGEEGMI